MSPYGIAAAAALAALVACSALFSAAETAITSIGRTKARALRKRRDARDRAVVALVDDRDRAYFGGRGEESDQVGYLDGGSARFGPSYAAEPDKLIEELAQDEAIAAADTLLLTVPNQLGVDYNAHVLESLLTPVAPALGWR